MSPAELLHPTPKGLYCPPGDFYIDPVAPVDRAVITHGHADHARAGHGAVLATPETLAIMAVRYGADFASHQQASPYGAAVDHHGVQIRLVPAGHVLGSAQVVVEKDDLRMVVTGDYKRRRDPTCAPFEVVPCDIFITEATFALPVFHHPDTETEIAKLLASVRRAPDRSHLVGAYALGKAQRVICHLREMGYTDTIFLHGAMVQLCELYQRLGVDLGDIAAATVSDADKKRRDFAGKIIICPPSAVQTPWARRFSDPLIAFASGWMGIRQRAKQRGVELPLIISDHADWAELTTTIEEVNPAEVWITHGRDDALTRWAELQGRLARPLRLIGYEDDAE